MPDGSVRVLHRDQVNPLLKIHGTAVAAHKDIPAPGRDIEIVPMGIVVPDPVMGTQNSRLEPFLAVPEHFETKPDLPGHLFYGTIQSTYFIICREISRRGQRLCPYGPVLLRDSKVRFFK